MRDVGFAFNDKDFSDRILHLQLVQNPLDSDSDIDDSQKSNKKQKTRATTKSDAACEENSNSSTSVEVKTLHINSAVLASCSPFFYKLFKNGMKESQERNLTLKINQSEEGAFMDLLNFMYSDTLSASSASDLLAVLMLADKFEVTSCASYCCTEMLCRGMSLESALLYTEIPSSILVGDQIQMLIDEAKEYLVKNYADWIQVADREKALALPLSAIKAVLSGELRVGSEDDVYEFILKWGRAHYPKKTERQQVITELIAQFIHFPYLRISTIKEIQESPEFDSKKMSNLILESLYLNGGYPDGVGYRVPRATCQRVQRDYYRFPIKETRFGSCHVVYLNIETSWLEIFDNYNNDKEWRSSQIFFLGGLPFKYLVGPNRVNDDDHDDGDYLGLFLERMEGKTGTCTFDYELEVQKCGDDEIWKLVSIYEIKNCSLSERSGAGSTTLFGTPWRDLVKESDYVVNQILHLRAKFTIKDSNPIG